jgi:hypothetical protein
LWESSSTGDRQQFLFPFSLLSCNNHNYSFEHKSNLAHSNITFVNFKMSSSSSASKLFKGKEKQKGGKGSKNKKQNKGTTIEENSQEITPAMNTSRGTNVEEVDDIQFQSFTEKKQSQSTMEEETSEGENEKRDRTDTLSTSKYAPTSPSFSLSDSDDDEEIAVLKKKRRRLAFLEIAFTNPCIDLHLVDEKVDNLVSSYKAVDDDGEFIEDLDESTYNLIKDYCTRKGYFKSSQATSSTPSPVDSDTNAEDGEDSGVVEETESEGEATTTPVHRYHSRHELSVLGASNPVLMSESDLLNKHLTTKRTVQKVTKYVAAVQALKNSNVHYKENREALDEKVKVILDLYWGVSTSELKLLARNWRSLDLSSLSSRVLLVTVNPLIRMCLNYQLRLFYKRELSFREKT